MYTYQTEEQIAQFFDWKQFGVPLFIQSIYSGEKHQSQLNRADIAELITSFLKKLFFHHRCDDSHMRQWKRSLHTNQKVTLKDSGQVFLHGMSLSCPC